MPRPIPEEDVDWRPRLDGHDESVGEQGQQGLLVPLLPRDVAPNDRTTVRLRQMSAHGGSMAGRMVPAHVVQHLLVRDGSVPRVVAIVRPDPAAHVVEEDEGTRVVPRW